MSSLRESFGYVGIGFFVRYSGSSSRFFVLEEGNDFKWFDFKIGMKDVFLNNFRLFFICLDILRFIFIRRNSYTVIIWVRWGRVNFIRSFRLYWWRNY